MSEVREYSYKISGLNAVEDSIVEQIVKEFESVSGVVGVNVKKQDGLIEYVLDQWSSDYDAFSKLSELCENYGLELLFEDDEIIENEVQTEEAGQSEEKDIEDDEKEPVEIKHKLTKGDFGEKIIILLLAIGFIVAGSLLGKHPNVQPWIYMIGFTIASYEILYDVIVKATEKVFVFEELLTFLGALILTYQGKMVTSAVIMLIYSCLNFAVAFAKHKVAIKKESLMQRIASCDENESAILSKKLRFIEDNEKVVSIKTLKFESKRSALTLAIFILAVLTVFIPPLFTIKTYWLTLSSKWLYLGACVLILNGVGEMLFSLSYAEFNGVINAYENDVEISSVDDFLALNDVSKVCFDKSGVLVKGYKVENVHGDEKVILYALSGLSGQTNGVARAIIDYAGELKPLEVTDLTDFNGLGLSYTLNSSEVLVGSRKFFKDRSVEVNAEKDGKSHLYVAVDSKQIGYISFNFEIYSDSYGAIAEIKHDLDLKTEILSADESVAVTSLKKEIKADHAISGASPKFKAERVKKENAVYVGDEVNDSQTLTQVGRAITFGESGKIAVKSKSVRKVPFILKLAKRTAKAVKFNKALVFSFKLFLLAISVVLSMFTQIDFIWWIFAIDACARAFTVINSSLNSSEVA